MYTEHGQVREQWFEVLSAILAAADRLGMVIEVTLFSKERKANLAADPRERATREMARLREPYRNVILQIWNECSIGVRSCFEVAKTEDADRLVTNSSGGSNVLGEDEQNCMLDLPTLHTIFLLPTSPGFSIAVPHS